MSPAVYTGYYIGNDGYIIGPDPKYSAKFSVKDDGYIVGPTNSGMFYLATPPRPDDVRYVYGPVGPRPGSATKYYATKDGHFYGPDKRLPWFD